MFSGRGESNEFPHTLRYPSTSVWHETQISECTRTRREADVERHELSPDMTETEFRSLYERITGDMVTDESWQGLKQDYKRFEDEYRAAVGVDGDGDAGSGQDRA